MRAGGHALLLDLSGAQRSLCKNGTLESAPGICDTPNLVPGANQFLRALAERHPLANGEAVALPPPPQNAHARLEEACSPQVAGWLDEIRHLDPRLHAHGGHIYFDLHAINRHAFAHFLLRFSAPFRCR